MSTVNPWPSADDVLRYLDLGRGRAAKGGEPLLAGLALFGTGLLVGAGLALLFAPTSGEELREEIAEKVGELQERVGGDGANGQTA